MSDIIIRLAPKTYIHVLNTNTNITYLEVGPKNFFREEHETVIAGPSDMIVLGPREYCRIANPVILDENGKPVRNELGEIKVKHCEFEIRTHETHPEPFPLYPGEVLAEKQTKFLILSTTQALKLRAVRDFEKHKAGDQWIVPGPFTYIPRIEEEVLEVINATIIGPNTALRLRATEDLIDANGNQRNAGEEWLIRQEGAYIPRIYEQVVGLVPAFILTEKIALHLRATSDFVDYYGIKRMAGDEWLVTNKLAPFHIQDVFEQRVKTVSVTALTHRQYCVVLNPIDPKTGKNKLGHRKLRKGEAVFFLQPGESLENGIEDIKVLEDDEALLLRAREEFMDPFAEKKRLPGEKWMIKGPIEYIPLTEVEVLEKRKSIPLDVNEGIYVRDTTTGEVRLVRGKTYLLDTHEELWSKDLTEEIEYLVAAQKLGSKSLEIQKDKNGNPIYDPKILAANKRDKTRAVSYKIPHNSVTELYNFKTKQHRVVFGPNLILLEPDEDFTLVQLSGGDPKLEDQISSLSINLGPDFLTDTIEVDTCDHARLLLKLSYSWYFKVDRNNKEEVARIFSVKDFVGDSCKTIASKIRGSVSTHPFDEFHKNSADIIRLAVFGKTTDGSDEKELLFPANNLAITSVDIQAVEPVDQKTRDLLQKSVTLAIEIATKTLEMNASHIAMKAEQESKAKLTVQNLEDKLLQETAQTTLLERKAENASIARTGQAIADSRAQAEAETIKGNYLLSF